MEIKKIENKRGLSEVVTTTLLVLLSFIAIGVIAGIVIPMIKDNLSSSNNCFSLREGAKVIDLGYTCSGESQTSVTIKRGMDDIEINGFIVSLLSGTSSRSYKIKTTEEGIEGVLMYDNSEDNPEIIIPSQGGAETYKFDFGNVVKVELGILTENGKTCEMDSFTIKKVCLDADE